MVYGIFFFKSVLWVAEPLIEHFEKKEAEQFTVEECEDKADLDKITDKKVKVILKDFEKPIPLSKSLLQKAQKEPQKLPNTNLWIYKDYIFSSQEKIKNKFGNVECNSDNNA